MRKDAPAIGEAVSKPKQRAGPVSDALLIIRNHHTAACGDPPIVSSEAGNPYIGYFENSFGEQWIFTLDRESGKAVLRGGDVGWNTTYEVVDGCVAGLRLGKEEQPWLTACWSAATGKRI